MKQSAIVVGLQWGDEGKGKVIDVLARDFDYVVRWNGGNNAGHTVVVAGVKYPLSLVPSGVIAHKKLLIAQGVVINPKVLLDEIALLTLNGFRVDLTIDPRCHIVMPYHQLMDAASELWKGKDATGSLHLGIGYCYEDRNNRAGIRLEFLIRPALLREKLTKVLPLKRAIIEKAYGMKTDLNLDTMVRQYALYGRKLKRYAGDVSSLIARQWTKSRFLFEQAHGTMLDPVFGTYPFTVAPPTIASAVFPAVGIPSRPISTVGVVKAYTTRVGNGPFPTELFNRTGEAIRRVGNEFGTVSKRPRRVGWLDLAILRYAVRLNGCTSLTVTKLDVLTGIHPLLVCVGYKRGTKIYDEFPGEISLLPGCRPVYKKLAGWTKSLRNIKSPRALPREAKEYLDFISRKLKVPVSAVSLGPERKEFIRL